MEILSLQDLTPIMANEHWETWLLMNRRGISRFSWNQWISMWRKTLDAYWIRQDGKKYDAR